jgi:glucuronokinase
MPCASASTPARAALAGNPSDGYGGMTLAVCLPDFAARATAAPRAEDLPADPGSPRAGDGAARLVDAAARRFAALAPGAAAGAAIDVRTTIPRQVGLAGSSAIVISALRALAALAGVELDDATLAAEALAAETEELGIAAGPQDRVVQVHGGLLAMDFATGRHEPLDPALLPPLFVAWRRDGGVASGGVHGALRARHAAGEPAVVAAMRELAGLAATARDALLAGDRATFARCVDGSFDVRARIVPLDPVDARLVAIAHAHGAAVNYAGSGGAVVGVAPADAGALAAAYAAEGLGFALPRPGRPAERR